MVVREPQNYIPLSKRQLPKGEKFIPTSFKQSWKKGKGGEEELVVKKAPVKKALPKPKQVEVPEVKYVPGHLRIPEEEKIVLDFTRQDLIENNFLLGDRFVSYAKAIHQRYDANGFLEHFEALLRDATQIGNVSLKRASSFLVDMMKRGGYKGETNGTIESITALSTFVKTTSDFKQYLQDDIWRLGRDNDLSSLLKIFSQPMSEKESSFMKEAIYNSFLDLESYEVEDMLELLGEEKYEAESSNSIIKEVLLEVIEIQREEEEKLFLAKEAREKKYEAKCKSQIEAALKKLYIKPTKENFKSLDKVASSYNDDFFISVLEESLEASKKFNLDKFKAGIRKFKLENLAELFEVEYFEPQEESSSPLEEVKLLDLSDATQHDLKAAGITRARTKGGSFKSSSSKFSDSAIESDALSSSTSSLDKIGHSECISLKESEVPIIGHDSLIDTSTA